MENPAIAANSQIENGEQQILFGHRHIQANVEDFNFRYYRWVLGISLKMNEYLIQSNGVFPSYYLYSVRTKMYIFGIIIAVANNGDVK